MKKLLLFTLYCGFYVLAFAQPESDSSWKRLYRASSTKINDLVNTKMQAKFDYAKAYMYGQVWITLRPHFYPTDSLELDAKQMDIYQVELVKADKLTPLHYGYDGWSLKIKLDKTYSAEQVYTIYIKYTSKPNEAKVPGDAKGLYFINPTENQKDVPTQIWTDGETEKTSMWCPTIDKPNQKTTQEFQLTVPEKWVTLSNGKLMGQQKNPDGTRTDDWKMDLPHAPYLFFLAVGDFSIIRDKYKRMEVNYYVEPSYASTAKRIFGLTPAMIAYFERITGVPYPWVKYSQIVVRNFTSTAMENTTTTAHDEVAQQDARELVDGNRWESTIAHELFHHWFGDYVTCESWSNLTLNESFANYAQYLWFAHQWGEDRGQEELYNGMVDYLHDREAEKKDLVRYYYADREDMFDIVSYQKGGLILHMLHSYLGDSAFFQGLHLYLTTNKFQSAEAAQLRLALEAVSGKDLHWFFDQWYYGSGHPKVQINYGYDEIAKQVSVTIRQTQGADHLFKIPLTIAVYSGSKKANYPVLIHQQIERFVFDCPSRPDLVNVDAEKIILWDKTDNRSLESFVFQYDHRGNYVDRREAIVACSRQQNNPIALALLKKALVDPYFGLRLFTLNQLNMKSDTVRQAVEPTLVKLAKSDPKSYVRARAIELLGNLQALQYKDLMLANLEDSSYSVAGAALTALAKVDSSAALAEAKKQMHQQTKRALTEAVLHTLTEYGSEDEFDYIAPQFQGLPFILPNKMLSAIQFTRYLAKVQSLDKLQRGIDLIVAFRSSLPGRVSGRLNAELSQLALTKESAGLQQQADWIKSRLTQ
jgi:aminopeptidase N